MKLITELNEDVKYSILEEKDGKKYFFIEGIWMQGGIKNRNGRMYPVPILEKEVDRYNRDYVGKGRAFGELGHPSGPTINLERVSHMIVSLVKEGNNFIGKAKVMDTPYGTIVKNLIDGGARLGVSTRGMGSLKEQDGVLVVQEDFFLASGGDIVADPSAPDAFVQGIMEGVEWVWDNGILKAHQVEAMKQEIVRAPAAQVEAVALKLFENFINRLSQVK